MKLPINPLLQVATYHYVRTGADAFAPRNVTSVGPREGLKIKNAIARHILWPLIKYAII